MEADWDLHAVVRGCSAAARYRCNNSHARPSSAGAQFQTDEESLLLVCQEPFEARRRTAFEELHELYKPFFRKPESVCWQNPPLASTASSSSSPLSSLFERTKSNPSSFSHIQKPSTVFKAGSQATKSKKRKNTMKKVCQVPAESVSSDVWAWRKYGQKPIKGSPFPRSYYRCSSSKGCLARKQVERNRSDPGMFIVTYTGEHNHPAPTHRNSLAGVTRQKPSPSSTPPSDITSSDSNPQATCSSPNASEAVLGGGSLEEKEGSVHEREQEGEMEDESGFSDMVLSDDFFVGLELEGLMGSDDCTGDGCWDPFQTCFSFPWTAAAAGGS